MPKLLLLLLFLSAICVAGVGDKRKAKEPIALDHTSYKKIKHEQNPSPTQRFRDPRSQSDHCALQEKQDTCEIFNSKNLNKLRRFKNDFRNPSRQSLVSSIEQHSNECKYYHPIESLSFIANTLQRNERALHAIAQQVLRMKLSDKEWTAQHLSMLANALSKLRSCEANKALENIAAKVLTIDLTKNEWTGKPLSLTAIALSRVDDRQAKKAVRQIAKQVTSTELKKGWNSLDLSIITQAFSMADGEEMTGVLENIAEKVAKMKLENWEAQPLAKLINGLSKKKSDRITKALTQVVGQMAKKNISNWPAESLSNLVIGLSKVDNDQISDYLKEIVQQMLTINMNKKEWTAQSLSLTANAISKLNGRQANKVLNKIAAQVASMKLADASWTSKNLAVIAKAFSYADGEDVTTALENIATQVALQNLSYWLPKDLAMMASALSKKNSDQVTEALRNIALHVSYRELDDSEWTVQDLAMTAHAVSGVDDTNVSIILENIAKQVTTMDLSDCLAKHLAIMANALIAVKDDNATAALKHIAKQVDCMQNLSNKAEWTAENLALLANGLCRISSHSTEAHILRLITCYNEEHKCGHAGMLLLKSLCRLTLLSQSSILEGIKLAVSYNKYVLDKNRTHRADFYWCISLLLFAVQEHRNVKKLSATETSLKTILRDFNKEKHSASSIANWQVNFVSLFRNALFDNATVSSKLGAFREDARISNTQQKVLRQLKQEAVLETIFYTEALIEEFPVDIVVEVTSREKYLLVEVDGPQHFLEDKAGKLYLSAKDRFSGYVIKNIIGYNFMRINYKDVEDEEILQSFIKKTSDFLYQ